MLLTKACSSAVVKELNVRGKSIVEAPSISAPVVAMLSECRLSS